MRIILTIILQIFGLAGLYAQQAPPELLNANVSLEIKGKLPRVLKETSGLEQSRSGLLWTHNDDRFPVLYGLDTAGNISKAIHLNHVNNGWEGLAYDDDHNMYIGAFGNNRNDRDSLIIYKLGNPDAIDDGIVNAEMIKYAYSDQSAFPPPPEQMNFDMDAFISLRDSLYLFTKNRTEPSTGYTRIYRLPKQAGRHSAVPCDSLFLGKGSMTWVTGADISPDGKWLALLSHDCLWLVTDFGAGKFSRGKIYKVPLGHYSHKTGISFFSESQVYIVDELEFNFIGGRIYSLDLSNVFQLIQQIEKSVR